MDLLSWMENLIYRNTGFRIAEEQKAFFCFSLRGADTSPAMADFLGYCSPRPLHFSVEFSIATIIATTLVFVFIALQLFDCVLLPFTLSHRLKRSKLGEI